MSNLQTLTEALNGSALDYLDSLQPPNRKILENVCDKLAVSEGCFRVPAIKADVHVSDIKTSEQALHYIFDLSQNTHQQSKNGESAMSPLGVAMHIKATITPPAPEKLS